MIDQPLLNKTQPKLPLLMIFYCVIQISNFVLIYSTLNHYTHSIFSFAAFKFLYLALILFLYIHFKDQKLYSLGQNYSKLLIALTILQIVATLCNNYIQTILPLTEACIFNQLIPGLMILLKHIFIQTVESNYLIMVLVQVSLIFFFQSSYNQLIIAILSPISSSLMGTIRQVKDVGIDPLTIIFYSSQLCFPITMLMAVFMEQNHYSQLLFHMYDKMNMYCSCVIVVCLSQLGSYYLMQQIMQQIQSQRLLWLISGLIVLATLPFQIFLFKDALTPQGFTAELLIVILSMMMFKD